MLSINETKKYFSSDKVVVKHGFGTIKLLDTDPLLAGKVFSLKQIHSSRVIVIDSTKPLTETGDALIYQKKFLFPVTLVVRTADCFPVLIFDKQMQTIAAVHAGWKGASEKIVTKTLLKMQELGGDLKKVQVLIGPGINSSCYPIFLERKKLLEDQFGDMIKQFIIINEKSCYLNILKMLFIELTALKVEKRQIDYYLGCTHCQKNFFHSYRREGSQLLTNNYNFISL